MPTTRQRRRIAVMRIPLHALAGLGLSPGDPGYDAAYNSTLPQNVQAQNQLSANQQANARYQVNYAIYQQALANWNLNQQQRQAQGLPPAPMPIPPNPADYVSQDQGAGNVYLSARGADTVAVSTFAPSPYQTQDPGTIPHFDLYSLADSTPGSPGAQANAAAAEAARHAGNLASQQASAYALLQNDDAAGAARDRAATAQRQQQTLQAQAAAVAAADQVKAATTQKQFDAWSTQQHAIQVANSFTSVPSATSPQVTAFAADPSTAAASTAASSSTAASGSSTLQQLQAAYLASHPDTGSVIGNGSILGQGIDTLSAPAASFLPAAVASSLPSWAQNIPLWGAIAGIAGLGFVIYDHQGKKHR